MERQTERMVGDLCSEFAGQFERSQIEQVMSDSVERVLASATVFEFVPLMVYRFTREPLDAIMRSRGDDAEGAGTSCSSASAEADVATSHRR